MNLFWYIITINIANGTHLVLKSKELAEYAGKQFIDVYGKLILGR